MLAEIKRLEIGPLRIAENGGYGRDQIEARMKAIDWVVVPSTWWEVFGLVASEAWMFRASGDRFRDRRFRGASRRWCEWIQVPREGRTGVGGSDVETGGQRAGMAERRSRNRATVDGRSNARGTSDALGRSHPEQKTGGGIRLI